MIQLMWKSLALSQKIKHKFSYDPAITSKRTESRDIKRYVHSSIIHNSQKMGTIQMLIVRWIDKQNMAYTYIVCVWVFATQSAVAHQVHLSVDWTDCLDFPAKILDWFSFPSLIYIHYSAIKRNDIFIYATKQIHYGNIDNEISQPQVDKYYIIPIVCGTKNRQIHRAESKIEVSKN